VCLALIRGHGDWPRGVVGLHLHPRGV
jgi:hypothetical protein